MWEFLQSIVNFFGKLIPGSGKKRETKTIDASGDVWDKSAESTAPNGDRPN